MLNFILKRLFYGFLVMLGVVTVVFFLFNVLPGDPARMMLGQHADQEMIDLINKDLGRDRPVTTQYLMFLNDISPISIHNEKNPDSHIYLDKKKYSFSRLFKVSSEKVLVLKIPYLRRSYITKQKVADILIDKYPETIVLAATSIIIASIIGIFLGIVSAIRKNSWFDNGVMVISVLGMSGPSFYIGMIIALLFGHLWSKHFPLPILPLIILAVGSAIAIYLDLQKKKKGILKNSFAGIFWKRFFQFLGIGFGVWMAGYLINSLIFHFIPLIDWYANMPGTSLNVTGSLRTIDDLGNSHLDLKNLILPALTLGIRPLAIIVQLTRSSLLDVLSQDYIRTATAKGLNYYLVVFKHALKNALNPVVTAISGWFAGLMAGAVFVEVIFAWKGVGFEMFDALIKQDLPVVMGGVLTVGLIFVVINICVDIMYGILDPRVRVQ